MNIKKASMAEILSIENGMVIMPQLSMSRREAMAERCEELKEEIAAMKSELEDAEIIFRAARFLELEYSDAVVSRYQKKIALASDELKDIQECLREN